TLAAHGTFPGCTVEFVHLGDATVRAIGMKPKTLAQPEDHGGRSAGRHRCRAVSEGRIPTHVSPLPRILHLRPGAGGGHRQKIRDLALPGYRSGFPAPIDLLNAAHSGPHENKRFNHMSSSSAVP